MDRHRGDRYGGGGGYQDGPRYSRGSSRYSSDGPPMTNHQPRRGSSPSSFRISVDTRSFESPPSHGHRASGSYRPIGGRDDRYGDSRGYEHNYDESPFVSGQKRGYSRGGPSPDHSEGAKFAKLFVGSVPSYVTENDIRPIFEEHGNVIEVALIKDRKTGQQRGCCFIKYSTPEEADRAIRALHNQYTLPGGVGPIQVRYADGERERLGAVEYKLFVGSLNKQATEQEVEEIFAPYGRVEDVYLMRNEMRQSRGCGFVKFAHKDVAWAAINALNGIYTMRGCDQPLTVRFADPKRPRLGDSRGGTALGPGPGPQNQLPGGRQPPNFNEPSGDRTLPSAWNHMGVQDQGVSNASNRDYANPYPRGGDMVAPPNPNPPMRAHGGSTDGHLPAPMAQPSTFPTQSFNMPFQHFHPANQQISPSQKPLESPQQQLPPHVPPPVHAALSYSQTQTSHTQLGPSGSMPNPAFSAPFTQAMLTQPLMGPGAQSAPSSATTLQAPAIINLQSQPRPNLPNQAEQFFPPTQPQQIPQPPHQSPSPLAQMLNQQTQTLRASFQSSQQAFSQLQQQVQMMQPSNQSVAPHQQGSQLVNQQWPKNVAQTGSNNSLAVPAGQVPSSSSAPAAASAVPGTTATAGPVKSNWTEHTSPDGFKYYYNNSTGESSWVEPEELKFYKQQQQPQQQKPAVQQAQVLNQPYQQYLPAQNQQPQMQAQPHMHLPQQQLQAQPQTQFSQQPLQAQPQMQFPQQPFPAQPKMQSSQQPLQSQPQTQFSHQPFQAQSQAHFPQQPLLQPSLNSPYQAPGAPPNRQNVQELSYPQYQGVSGGHPSNDPGLFQQGVPAQDWMWKNKQPTAPEELS